MKFFSFFKSPKFWSGAIHAAIIGVGSWASFSTGTPLPLVLTSGLNALLVPPQDAGSPAPIVPPVVVPVVPAPVVIGK